MTYTPGTELEMAWSKVSTKVCGFTFGSISLHLISKRIKEILIQKQQYNAKYLSQFNDKNAFRKHKRKIYIFFPDFGCMNKLCAYAYVHATFLSFIRVTFVADKEPPKCIFLS